MKTKSEILEETIAFYSEDPSRRALEGGKCQYLTEDGRMCALGRCLEEPEKFVQDNWSAQHILQDETVLVLKEEYRIDDDRFWQDIQEFHDTQSNWTETGLSEIGLESVDLLRVRYRTFPPVDPSDDSWVEDMEKNNIPDPKDMQDFI